MARRHLYGVLLTCACLGIAGCSCRQESAPAPKAGDAAKSEEKVVMTQDGSKVTYQGGTGVTSKDQAGAKNKGALVLQGSGTAKKGTFVVTRTTASTFQGIVTAIGSAMGGTSGKGGKGRGGRPSPEAEFKALDGNGDDELSLEEFLGKRWDPDDVRQATKLFTILDSNRDGRVTLPEYLKGARAIQFFRLDEDSDGVLSPGEFSRVNNQVLARSKNFKDAWAAADQNRDGRLSLEEFTAFMDSKAFVFYRKDQDGDNRLTLEEFGADWAIAAGARKEFERRDLNHDGLLTLEEFKTEQPKAAGKNAAKNQQPVATRVEEFKTPDGPAAAQPAGPTP